MIIIIIMVVVMIPAAVLLAAEATFIELLIRLQHLAKKRG